MKPLSVEYRRQERLLYLDYGHDQPYTLRAEFLRVHSPSAEVQGHGGVGGVLPLHKQDVSITTMEPCGFYALRLHFSDGHSSGLYTWDYLFHLAKNQDQLWQNYIRDAKQH